MGSCVNVSCSSKTFQDNEFCENNIVSRSTINNFKTIRSSLNFEECYINKEIKQFKYRN